MTVLGGVKAKSAFELATLMLIVIVVSTVPSIRKSSTPVTVTVCAVSQLLVVKVSELVTLTSVSSSVEMSRTTSVSGCASRTTVNVSVLPDSSTSVAASVSVTVNSGMSSSVVVTVTIWSSSGSNPSSELASSTLMTTLVVWSPSISTPSLTPVTVIVWGTFQSAGVKLMDARSTEASPLSSDVMVKATSEAGCTSRTMVNMSVVSDSSTSVESSVSSTV